MAKRILVADDEPDVVADLAAVLEDNGSETTAVSDCEETIRRVRGRFV